MTGSPNLLFFNFSIFIYLSFLVAVSLRCCLQALSSCRELGLLSIAVTAARGGGFSCGAAQALGHGLQ